MQKKSKAIEYQHTQKINTSKKLRGKGLLIDKKIIHSVFEMNSVTLLSQTLKQAQAQI